MTLRYPEIEWTKRPDGSFVASMPKYRATTYLCKGGTDQGFWNAILNGSALTSGGGSYGYQFASFEEATAAIKTEIHARIDTAVKDAHETIALYDK